VKPLQINTPSNVTSQQAVRYTDLAGWVNAARFNGGKTAAGISWAEQHAVAQIKCTKGLHISVYLFKHFKPWNFDTTLT
jgi:hypothetical protein